MCCTADMGFSGWGVCGTEARMVCYTFADILCRGQLPLGKTHCLSGLGGWSGRLFGELGCRGWG